MRVVYGYEVKDTPDAFVERAKEGTRIGAEAQAQGRWLVDSFPLRASTSKCLHAVSHALQ